MRWRSRARCRRGVSLRWTSSERWSWSLNRSDTCWELGDALPVLVWSTHCDVPLHWHRLHTVGVENSTLFLCFFLTLPYQRHVDTGTEGDGRHGVQHVDVQLGEDEGALEPGAHRLHAGVGVDRNVGHDVPESVRNVGEWMFTVIQDSRAIQYSSLMRKCTYNESIVSTPQSGGEGNVSPEIYSDQKLPEESSN